MSHHSYISYRHACYSCWEAYCRALASPTLASALTPASYSQHQGLSDLLHQVASPIKRLIKAGALRLVHTSWTPATGQPPATSRQPEATSDNVTGEMSSLPSSPGGPAPGSPPGPPDGGLGMRLLAACRVVRVDPSESSSRTWRVVPPVYLRYMKTPYRERHVAALLAACDAVKAEAAVTGIMRMPFIKPRKPPAPCATGVSLDRPCTSSGVPVRVVGVSSPSQLHNGDAISSTSGEAPLEPQQPRQQQKALHLEAACPSGAPVGSTHTAAGAGAAPPAHSCLPRHAHDADQRQQQPTVQQQSEEAHQPAAPRQAGRGSRRRQQGAAGRGTRPLPVSRIGRQPSQCLRDTVRGAVLRALLRNGVVPDLGQGAVEQLHSAL